MLKYFKLFSILGKFVVPNQCSSNSAICFFNSSKSTQSSSGHVAGNILSLTQPLFLSFGFPPVVLKIEGEPSDICVSWNSTRQMISFVDYKENIQTAAPTKFSLSTEFGTRSNGSPTLTYTDISAEIASATRLPGYQSISMTAISNKISGLKEAVL